MGDFSNHPGLDRPSLDEDDVVTEIEPWRTRVTPLPPKRPPGRPLPPSPERQDTPKQPSRSTR
ncbi:MAG: hypothetical protein U0271_23790 [Polyangiaceae bacterium]